MKNARVDLERNTNIVVARLPEKAESTSLILTAWSATDWYLFFEMN